MRSAVNKRALSMIGRYGKPTSLSQVRKRIVHAQRRRGFRQMAAQRLEGAPAENAGCQGNNADPSPGARCQSSQHDQRLSATPRRRRLARVMCAAIMKVLPLRIASVRQDAVHPFVPNCRSGWRARRGRSVTFVPDRGFCRANDPLRAPPGLIHRTAHERFDTRDGCVYGNI